MHDPKLAQAIQHYHAGQFDEAEVLCRELIVAEPNHANALHLFGAICNYQRNDPESAIDALSKAARLIPDNPHIHSDLAGAFIGKGDITSAIKHSTEALRLQPENPEAHGNLGAALLQQGNLPDAIHHSREALRLKPDFAAAHSNLGAALKVQGNLQDAIHHLREALRKGLNSAEVHSNLGASLRELGNMPDAVHHCRKALRQQPDFADAHLNLSLALLSLGYTEEAWREYEWRLKQIKMIRAQQRIFPQPVWDGSPMPGQTLLVFADQGLGDTLQFVRYLPMLKKKLDDTVIVLECQPLLLKSLQGISGADAVVPRKNHQIPETPFDQQIPLLSLPQRFGTTLDTVPSDVPYLKPDPVATGLWRTRMRDDTNLRVGLVWGGNPKQVNDVHRSCQLKDFAPVASIKGVTFYSLQKGPPAEQVFQPPTGLKIVNWMDEIEDFADTAALIEQLDLVIGVDTSVVHLAGALNKRVWILLPRYGVHWVWLQEREDSPWYPSARLFRQDETGRQGQLARVAEALERECQVS